MRNVISSTGSSQAVIKFILSASLGVHSFFTIGGCIAGIIFLRPTFASQLD